MRKIIVGLLSLALSWTPVFSAYASSPEQQSTIPADTSKARVIHVSPEDYPALEAQLSSQGYHQSSGRILLSSRNGVNEASYEETPAGRDTSDDGCNESAQPVDQDRASVNVSSNLSISGGSDKDAVIVLVVIGTFVLVVWTFYLFKYLYDISVGMAPCGRWSELMVSTSTIAGDTKHSANFSGLRYIAGFREGGTDVGISAEAGYADILLTETDSLKLQGAYWLVGPILRWRLSSSANPDYFQMDFMAGSTQNPEMGLLAQARAGLSFGVSERFRWGINLGAINLNLHDNEGIITDRHQYYYIMGMDFGYRF